MNKNGEKKFSSIGKNSNLPSISGQLEAKFFVGAVVTVRLSVAYSVLVDTAAVFSALDLIATAPEEAVGFVGAVWAVVHGVAPLSREDLHQPIQTTAVLLVWKTHK